LRFSILSCYNNGNGGIRDLSTFGHIIRELRDKRNITQKELARLIGVREATLSRYENDKRVYQWENLARIADALDTNTDYLLGRTNISATIEILMAFREISREKLYFFETYDQLDARGKSMLLERAKTLYALRRRIPTGNSPIF
jgi:transcriptional regulator with XRE-family HTH domain